MDKTKIIKRLLKLADSKGRITQRACEEAGLWPTTVEAAFGKWSEAVKAAGLAMGKPGKISKAEALADLVRVSKITSTRPSYTAYDKIGCYDADSLAKIFGSWAKACKAAGFHTPRRRKTRTAQVVQAPAPAPEAPAPEASAPGAAVEVQALPA